jgi:hypothetical protein
MKKALLIWLVAGTLCPGYGDSPTPHWKESEDFDRYNSIYN